MSLKPKSERILGHVHQDIHREIIELSKKGNRRAQYELYSLYSRAMFNVCMRILNSRENAEDALQDAFCEIFDKLESFRFESSFGACARKIVINTCINHLRKRKKIPVFKEDPNLSYPDEHEETDWEDIGFKVDMIQKAISKLPEGYRIILSLYLLEGYDHLEISDILGISESTSKTQYMKAKKKVKELILGQDARQI